MKNLFGAQDLLEIVQNGVDELAANATEVQRNAHKELKKKDCKALFLIQQSLDEGNFERISKSLSSKEAWDILSNYHEGDDKVKLIKLQSLRRKFELMQMEDDQKISEYISKLINLVNQMKACSEAITDQQIVEKIMRTISSRFDFIVVAIHESKDVKTLKIEELQSSLEAHELMVSERSNERSIQQALQVQTIKKDDYDRKNFKKGKKNSKGGNWSKGKNNGSDKGESSKEGNSNQKKKVDKKKIQCFKCEKFGHYASECWSGKGKQSNNDEEEAKIAQDDSDSESLFMMVTTISNESCNSESWFLDTGCSNHMTGTKTWLREVDFGRNTKVKLADHRVLVAEGMRNIAIEGKNGKVAIIE